MTMMKQQKKHARVYYSLLYGRHGTGSSDLTSTVSPLRKSERPLQCLALMTHSGVLLSTCGQVLRTRCVCVCELVYFLSSLYVVYLCCSLTQLWLQVVSEQNKRNHAKVKCHEVTGSRSYIAHLQAYVSDGCVTLFISNTQCLLYQQKGMCNFNRRTKIGRTQDMMKKCSMIDLMKMLMQWESSTTFRPVAIQD